MVVTVNFDEGVPGYWGKFIVGLVVFLSCDGTWLKLATGRCCSVYPMEEQSREESEHTRRRTVPAVLISGCLASLITPVFVADTAAEAAALGSLLGLLVFGTFNVVEWALWSKWSVRTGLLDSAYGIVVYAISLAMQYIVSS